jgi:Xaa-Pro dipeptidase
MEIARLDALVLRLPENVLLLSGFWPMIGAAFLVFPLEGPASCILPDSYTKEAESTLWKPEAIFYPYGCLDSPDPESTLKGLLSQVPGAGRWRRIGHEASFELVAACWNSAESRVPTASTVALLHSVFSGCELVDVSALLMSERKTKTAYEVERLRIASEISCFGLEAFEQAVNIGVSGVELAAEVERATMIRGTGYRGAERVRAYAQVTVGVEETILGYRPNVISTARRLQDGEVALLELGLVADGYWADRTRVRVAGTPSDEQIMIHETVCKAQKAAIAAIRTGARAADVDEAARSVIRDSGNESYFIHITGHGLGFGYHESSPILGPKSTEILEENMLTSVEPGIYRRPYGGFRVEDDVLVTAQGPVVLGPFRNVLANT